MAADAAAADGVAQFGVPLIPEELEELLSAASREDEVIAPVLDYRFEHPEAWAGVYVDADRGRIVVLIADDIEVHRAALLARVTPPGVLEVVPARWPLRDLEALQDRIVADSDWLTDQGAELTAVGVAVEENLVQLDVSSARSSIAALAVERFDADGMLRVVVDGTGVAQMPRGDLTGVAVDAVGNPVGGLVLELRGDVRGAGPRGDIGLGTGPDGRFEITEITATGYDVRLYRDVGSAGHELARPDWILAGRARALVYPGETTEVTIVVAPAP